MSKRALSARSLTHARRAYEGPYHRRIPYPSEAVISQKGHCSRMERLKSDPSGSLIAEPLRNLLYPNPNTKCATSTGVRVLLLWRNVLPSWGSPKPR